MEILEYFLVPIVFYRGELCILLQKDVAGKKSLPQAEFKHNSSLQESFELLLKELLITDSISFHELISASHLESRTVDVFDRMMSGKKVISIVQAVAINNEYCRWKEGIEPIPLIQSHQLISELDSFEMKIINSCYYLFPFWVKHSTFIFQILPHVFSINDLRMVIGILMKEEVDPGNFHRRLKRLNILKPQHHGMRIHKWMFDWQKVDTLMHEGLIP